jgi:hypothetical protein
MNRSSNVFCYLLIMVVALLFCSSKDILAVNRDLQNRGKLLIVKINPAGGTDIGAGIIYGARGGYLFIATAYHVVPQGVESVEFEMYRNVPVPAQSFFNDKEMDLSLLRVDLRDPFLSDFPVSKLPLQTVGYTDAVAGLQVFPIGHPYGDLWDLPAETGSIKNVTGNNFEFKYRCEPGHSGGGVFNNSGDLVGMCLRKSTPSLCKALRFSTIAKTIQNQGGGNQLANRDEIRIPDFSNQFERNGRDFLEKACEPFPCITVRTQSESSEIIDRGRIIRTEPGKNVTIKRGYMVTLVISSGPAPLEYPRDPNGQSKGLNRYIFAESSYYRGFLIIMNDQQAPFKDSRVRKAIDYMLPYSRLQKVVGDPPPASPMIGYKPRPTEARRYMIEAGYPHGNYPVTVLVGRELTFYKHWGEIITTSLRPAGFEVTVSPLNSNEVISRVRSGNFQMAIVQAKLYCPKCIPPDKGSAKIVSVECLSAFKLRVKIKIECEEGIQNYVVGTTWGPGKVEETFSPAYPKKIEKTVILDKQIRSDPQRHKLQVGLWVKTADSNFTLSHFSFEPQGKCPGH